MEKEQKTVILKDALQAVRRAVKSMPEAENITLDESAQRSDLKFQLEKAALEVSSVYGPGMIILRCEIPGNDAEEISLKALGEDIREKYPQCNYATYDGKLVLQQTIIPGKNESPDGLGKKLFDGVMRYLTGPVSGAVSQLRQESEEEQENMHDADYEGEEESEDSAPLFDYDKFSRDEPDEGEAGKEPAGEDTENQEEKQETEEENEEMGLFRKKEESKEENIISKQLAQGSKPQKIVIDPNTAGKKTSATQQNRPAEKKRAPEAEAVRPVPAKKAEPKKPDISLDVSFDDDETDDDVLSRLMKSLNDDDDTAEAELEDPVIPDTDLPDEGIEISRSVTAEEDATPHIPYVQAPEVAKQMHDMYEEINRTFDIRKQQADEREATIGRFFDRVKAREEKLKQDKAAHESEYQEMVVKLRIEQENMKADFEKEKKKQQEELRTEIEKLESEKALVEIEKKKAAEANERAEALQKEAKDIRELAKSEMAYCISEEDAKKLRSDLAEVQQSVKERDGTIERLKAALKMSQQSVKSGTNAQKHEEQVKKLEGDIARLKEKGKTKDKIIGILNKKSAEWKAKESAYKNAVEQLSGKAKGMETEIASLKSENESLKADAETAGKTDSDVKKDLKKCIQSLGESNKLVEALKKENEDLRSKAASTAKALESVQKRAGELEAQASASPENAKSIEEEAAETEQRLSDELGISVARQPRDEANKNNETILAGEDGTVKIIINLNAHILYMSKKLKSARRYSKNVMAWNRDDIRTSYTFEGDTVVCRHAYRDIIKSVSMINERFESLA